MIEQFKDTIRKSFQQLYHNLGLTILLSLIWTLSMLTIIGAGPATAGVFYVMNKIAHEKKAHSNDFTAGIKKFWFAGIFFTAITLSLMGSAILGIYLTYNSGILFFKIVSVIYIYGVVLLFLAAQFFLPVMIELKSSILDTFKKSFLIALDNILYSIVTGLLILLLLTVYILFPGLGVLIGIGSISLINNNALLTLLDNY